MSSIHKLCVRTFPHHPVHAPVHLFRKKRQPVKNAIDEYHEFVDRPYLTLPLNKGSTDAVVQNVLVASTNPIASKYIMQCNDDIEIEQHSISVAKHLAELMQLHLVTCITMSCDARDCSEVWDASYYVPPAMSVQTIRIQLHNHQL